MIAKLFPCFLMMVALTSCDDDDDMPIVTNDMVDQMLNSVEISNITCVSAIATGNGMSKKDMNRFYPKKFPILKINYVAEDEYLQSINSNKAMYPEHQYIEDWDESVFRHIIPYLKPSTTYLYKATLTIDSITFSGEVRRFTTASVDDYLWMNVIEAGFQSAKLGGSNLLKSVIGESTFSFSYTDSNFWNNATPSVINSDSLIVTLDGLWPGHTYQYRIEAISNDGWIVSSPIHTFTTPKPSEYIYVDQPTQITASTAFISGKIDTNVFSWVDNRQWKEPVFIHYCTDKNNLENRKDVTTGAAEVVNGSFGFAITRLIPATTYYFNVGAYWHYGPDDTAVMFYTDTQSFTTAAE
ncbi:MAG: fibronectin type III domain-containing protein [Prevotella sp.]|nr:fibronectin type III domain-containing protein [Prevotella sp.]